MGKITDRLYDQIKRNQEGIIQYGIGLERVGQLCDNVRQGNMIVIGAPSGSGKTSFVMYSFVYRPIMECIERGIDNFRIIIFCMEMSAEMTLSKLLTMYVFEKYGIVMGMKDILSYSKPQTDEEKAIIDECRDMMSKIERYIRFVEGSVNGVSLQNYFIKYFQRYGSFVDSGDYARGWIPKDPNFLHLAIMDHIGEVNVPPKSTKKIEIDSVADCLKNFRNICGLSSVVLQQINRGASAVDRRTKFPGIEMQDLKDSGNVAEKADVVMGLYNPYRDKLKEIGGYNVAAFGNRLRIVQVLKNRYGISDVSIGASFYGEISMFAELPKGNTLSIGSYDRYKSINWLREERSISNGNINNLDDI